MFYADYHVHSSFSSDCNAPMEDMILQGINLGLKQLTFTDHLDYDYPDTAFPFLIDFDEYCKHFSDLKNKYTGKIQLLLGVEIGLQPHLVQRVADFTKNYPFDFVIGSTHVVDRLDLYNGDFFEGKEQKNAYLRYFEDVLHSVNVFKDYDVYGHIDYIIRYGNYEIKKLSYLDYQDIIDTILTTIIHTGKGLEINTSGYKYQLNQTHPQLDILKRYKELGGQIVTVGSDAHSPSYICSHFDIAYAMLKDTGFHEITIFKDRQPAFIKI